MRNYMRELFHQAKKDFVSLLRGTWREVKRRKWLLLAVYLALAVAVFLIRPYDREIHERMTNHRIERLVKIANKLRRWGDFRDTVIITVVVFTAGALARRRTWRRAALAAFTAACIAGLATNVVRFTAGRPRPPVNMPDRFYGPTVQYKMQSFPSGHAATSTANGVALLVALPAAGLSAAGVVWACLYSRVHYLTDVLVGGMTGLVFGIIVGQIGRRINREAGEGDPLAAGEPGL